MRQIARFENEKNAWWIKKSTDKIASFDGVACIDEQHMTSWLVWGVCKSMNGVWGIVNRDLTWQCDCVFAIRRIFENCHQNLMNFKENFVELTVEEQNTSNLMKETSFVEISHDYHKPELLTLILLTSPVLLVIHHSSTHQLLMILSHEFGISHS